MEEQLMAWMEAFSYPAVVGLLLACGVGAPLSEDLILVTAGFLVSQTGGHLLIMMAVGWVGVVCGDLMLFTIGRRLGPRLRRHRRLGPLLATPRAQRIASQLERRGWTTIFGARFLPGFRLPTFLLAGVGGVPLRHFVLADGVGAAITAPLMVFLGHRFGLKVLDDIALGGRWIVAVVIVGILVLAAVWTYRHIQRLGSLRRVRP